MTSRFLYDFQRKGRAYKIAQSCSVGSPKRARPLPFRNSQHLQWLCLLAQNSPLTHRVIPAHTVGYTEFPDPLVNPALSHNLAPDVTTRPSENHAAAFSQLRTSLIKVLRNSPEAREPICDALELIEALQQQMESKRNPDAPGNRTARAEAAGQQEYVVQATADGPFLTERRPSGSQPFRCPKDAYDAAVRILAESREPLHFEEIHDRLNAAMGERQADYRLRVCLRFWAGHKVVERFRTRYRAVDPAAFVNDAERLWLQASKPPPEPR